MRLATLSTLKLSNISARLMVAMLEEHGLDVKAALRVAGLPHSLQGLGPDGCEFLICFDEGKASELSLIHI